jgi:phage terminase large subunit-like protein
MGEAVRAEDAPVYETDRREHASKVKRDRAQQVSAKYGQGRMRHGRVLQKLQDEMCVFRASSRARRAVVEACGHAGDQLAAAAMRYFRARMTSQASAPTAKLSASITPTATAS